MASSAFSFHCMICFEEFDPENNYPVVLPCGHTYVCINCANRLDKCMECRTPLAIKTEIPPPPPAGQTTPEIYHKENHPQHVRMSPALQRRQQLVQNRYGGHPSPVHGVITAPKPTAQVVTQRLPLPKNAVLLSLIQASEPARRGMVETPPEINRESEDIENVDNARTDTARTPSRPTPPAASPPRPTSRSNNPGTPSLLPKFNKASPLFITDSGLSSTRLSSSEQFVDDDDVKEHQIRVGTYLQGGPCGTYAVAVKTGLLVYPTLFEHALPDAAVRNIKDGNDARSKQGSSEQPDQWKKDVDELVKSSYLKKQQEMTQQHCHEKKSTERSQSSKITPTLFDGDEWHVEASLSHDVGMKLSTTLSHESDNRDDVIPSISSSFSMDGSGHGEANDDGALNRSLPLSNTMAFSRQLSAPIKAAQKQKESLDEFDRPLIRLKYGDRVQVVSMDSKGWVKLARGYGYIRLQDGKQLVKVGGTSDRACQIEATLHELSMERDRLKNEQTQLERLSAGLMIDLQSTLLSSDDHVITPAPEGMLRLDSDFDLSTRQPETTLDDSSLGTRSKPSGDTTTGEHNIPSRTITDLRQSKSHSPGGGVRIGGVSSPSPTREWTATPPTRINFRTGMSGHRALLSSNSHPHDFLGSPVSMRSMSNHSGISKSKKAMRPRASIY